MYLAVSQTTVSAQVTFLSQKGGGGAGNEVDQAAQRICGSPWELSRAGLAWREGGEVIGGAGFGIKQYERCSCPQWDVMPAWGGTPGSPCCH